MILIVGGTGTVGTEVVKQLSALGVGARAMVRKHSAKIDLPGIEQVDGDLARPETLSRALEGAETALLLSSPSQEAGKLQGNFIDAAKKAKLRNLVRLSAYGAAPDSTARLFRQHADIEERIRDAGVPFTTLRPAQFMQNLLGMRDSIAGRGEFYAPQGDGRVSLVDVRDVAAVAVRALTEPGHAGKTYDITGPEAITYHRVAEALTLALAHPVKYVNIPPKAYRDALVGAGVPDWMADGVLELYDIWRNGGAEEVTSVVETVARKQPYTIEQFARDYAGAFRGQTATG